MARRKGASVAPAASPSGKRKLAVDPYEVPDETESPKRPRRSRSHGVVEEPLDAGEEDDDQAQSVAEPAPTKRRAAAGKTGQVTTPSNLRHKTVPTTPAKLNLIDTPSRRNNADRSARKKSARALIDRVIDDDISDDEGDIAREIYESSEDEEESGDEKQAEDEGPESTTPSKTPGRKRGPAASLKRSPTPPRDLPPHEQYFYQNKPGLTKTSGNDLSSLSLLTRDEYFTLLRTLRNPHASNVDSLHSVHAQAFPQWAFELSQGFSACLYGYGSKRRLLHDFATYLSSKNPDPSHKILIINGYVRTLTTRDILSSLGGVLPSTSKLPTTGGTNSSDTLQTLLSRLSSSPASTITVLINSIDAPPLRKTATQSLLAQLASHPQIRLACSADAPDFPLLWDAGLRAAFDFVFHDCTTFAPFSAAELDVVDDVHELLGRRARRAGGREGVAFVLRSLPEKARSLFRLLVGEVLVASLDEGSGGGEGEEAVAVEYRMVYNKAVEEFICSSELAFRTLLKELSAPLCSC